MARTAHHTRDRATAAPVRHKRPRTRRTGTRAGVIRAELKASR